MNIFLIGINGIGMQGLAIIAKQQGHNVYGFDDNGELDILKEFGIIYSTKMPDNIDCIVCSSGIPKEHAMMIYAKEQKIKCYNRTEFWIEHIKLNDEKILIAGAHGKTTTSSIAAYLCNMKSYAIGGILNGNKYPAYHENDKFSILETDESDGSFIKWQGKYKILLNFNEEHIEYYGSAENLIEYYKNFAKQPKHCILIIEKQCQDFLQIPKANNIITYSKEGVESDFIFSKIKFEYNGINFNINNKPIFLPLLGEHNASNLTAVYAALAHSGMHHEQIQEKIASFPGVKKRMQKIDEKNGFQFWLDYGHHPNEINATLAAIALHKNIKPNVILEPHKYTRLNYTWNLWPQVFKGYKVFITDIHSANENIIENVNSHNFVKYLQENNIDAHYLNNIKEYEFDNDTIIFSAGKLSAKF